MRETIDDHDGLVMWVVDARSLDNEMWLRWKSDTMCSAGEAVFENARPLRLELWLLFDNAALALAFDGFASTAGCDLACLHELANVSGHVRLVAKQAV
jgi:hypothetical protein